MIERYVLAASTYASDIDNLITLIGVLVGSWFFLCEGVFFWLIWRYRAKPGVKSEWITGEEKSQKRWITIPHLLVLVCDVFIIWGAVRVWVEVKQYIPEDATHTVRVMSQQWAWSFDHPGPDGQLDTADDIRTVDELHIQVDKGLPLVRIGTLVATPLNSVVVLKGGPIKSIRAPDRMPRSIGMSPVIRTKRSPRRLPWWKRRESECRCAYNCLRNFITMRWPAVAVQTVRR